VPPQNFTGGARPLSHLHLPHAIEVWQIDLVEDEVDDAVKDLVLVGHVVVERHRLDAELGGQRSDGQRRHPARIGHRDGPLKHPLSAEAGAGGAGWCRHRFSVVLSGYRRFVQCTLP
jgi:hypothetical protein